ncbi:hypothetical protein C8Q79DRAFT_680799 [Trametes meyenii]|nr:hypothetical protein C8Q79DRAFT_680799 [Trametes meyenii]
METSSTSYKTLTPRLPDEICEYIIDSAAWRSPPDTIFDWEDNIDDYYNILRACCLTCRSWLSRSRFHLYTIVTFERDEDPYLFLNTITARPFLAERVRFLRVHIRNAGYIPFAGTELVQKLRNVQSLRLASLSFTGFQEQYPPRYHELVTSRFPITTLNIRAQFRKVGDLLRIIWAFRVLQTVVINSWLTSRSIQAEEAFRLCQVAGRNRHCVSLRKLELGSQLVPLSNFPPPLTFGTSIEDLTLYWQEDVSIWASRNTQAILDYMSSLHSLRRLTLILWPASVEPPKSAPENKTFYAWAVSVLSRMRGHRSLCLVRLRLWPSVTTHDATLVRGLRHSFGSPLATPNLSAVIAELPANCRLFVEVPSWPRDPPEGDTKHGDVQSWWKRTLLGHDPGVAVERKTTIEVRTDEQ